MQRLNGSWRRDEGGFALILAILALMLLTFLGLTLATLTSTELQIATNYRYGQQALYNAEAGLEYGKSLLRSMNWSLILPAPRQGVSGDPCQNIPLGSPSGTAPGPFKCWFPDTDAVPEDDALEPPPYARPDPHGNATRNFENYACDHYGGGEGFGVVLDDGGGFGPYQNVTNLPGVPAINGAFTLWVRRQFLMNTDGSFSDAPGGTDLVVVLTAEGTAPYAAEQSNMSIAEANRAVRTMEMTLSRTLSTPCGTRGGQVGGGPEGSNFSPCDPISRASLDNVLGSACPPDNPNCATSENVGVQ